MRTNLLPIVVPPPPSVSPPGRPPIEEFHKGIKFDPLPDGTLVWKAKTFVENAKTELKFLPLVRGFLESRKWIQKVDQSLDVDRKDPAQWAYAQWEYGRYASLWGQSLIANGNLCLKVRGLEQLEKGAVYLFAPTHNSLIETPLLYTALEAWMPGFLADQRFENSFLGQAMTKSERHVFVDRKDPQSAVRALMKAVRLLREDGNRFSFVMFPQGTRALGQKDIFGNRIDGYLIPRGQELWNGVAEIFLQTADHGVKLVPIVINHSGRVLPKGILKRIQTGEEVEIIIGRPSSLSDFGDRPRRKQEKEEMREKIMSTVVDFYRLNYDAPHIELGS